MRLPNDFKTLSQSDAALRMNKLGTAHIPFLFIIDYRAQNTIVLLENEIDCSKILFQFENASNISIKGKSIGADNFTFEKYPISKSDYSEKIQKIKDEIRKGNSFLTNFTQPTPISTNLSLQEIFHRSNAKFKLWLRDWFVVFSPELFIKIEQGNIASFPMKGTIDASIPFAETTILNDVKEMAEHATIVDLIRNDLSMVAKNVEVKRYRYVEKIDTNHSELLQLSSEIVGELPRDYEKNIGDIIFKLLPAGSICGAPKPKTLSIIDDVEAYDRGFYSGICGYFDGENLESAVMIRFIEQTESGFVFKSGGGITSLSDAEKEYEELIQKIYIPIY